MEKDPVVLFLFKVVFGRHFERLHKAKEMDDVLLACLRVAWSDATLHEANAEKFAALSGHKKEGWINEALGKSLDDFVTMLETYSTEGDLEKRLKVIERLSQRHEFSALKKDFSFGRYQKLINMGVKYYACVDAFHELICPYVAEWRHYSLSYADCPIDGSILGKITGKPGVKSDLSRQKWTQFPDARGCYEQAQRCIHQYLDENGKSAASNLEFDFIAWQPGS